MDKTTDNKLAVVANNRWGIVYVPMAGVKKKHRRWHQIKTYLELKGVQYDYIQSEEYGAVERLTRMYVENGYKTIIVVGGDTAVNDALNGIMNSSVERLEAWESTKDTPAVAPASPHACAKRRQSSSRSEISSGVLPDCSRLR